MVQRWGGERHGRWCIGRGGGRHGSGSEVEEQEGWKMVHRSGSRKGWKMVQRYVRRKGWKMVQRWGGGRDGRWF